MAAPNNYLNNDGSINKFLLLKDQNDRLNQMYSNGGLDPWEFGYTISEVKKDIETIYFSIPE